MDSRKIREYPAEWLMPAQQDLGERQKQLKSRRFSIRKNQFSWEEDSFRRSEREVKVLKSTCRGQGEIPNCGAE